MLRFSSSFCVQAARITAASTSAAFHHAAFRKSALVTPLRVAYPCWVRTSVSVSSSTPSTAVSDVMRLKSVCMAPHRSAKVVFEDNKSAEYKYIWLRDQCKCPACQDPQTGQKLVDTASLDLAIKPKSMTITEGSELEIVWCEKQSDGTDHKTVLDASWLYRYGQCFMNDTFDLHDVEVHANRPPLELWDRTTIWQSFPEVAYAEFMSSDEGLKRWLDLVYRFGVAVLRGVPTNKKAIIEVVDRFAYVKQTSYGQTFEVLNQPSPEHLAYTGRYLEHHTDLNYRDKSPGFQLLHCLKANGADQDLGGKSFFVDGFAVAKYLERNEPTAYHMLSTVPMRFQIKVQGQRYSHLWPVITLDSHGDVHEIHYNTRTHGPLQVPKHLITPYYHALKLWASHLRDPANELKFQMVPGDLVGFNNRRVLHGRTSYDPRKMDRHLIACYVDIDEVFSKYDQLLGDHATYS